jgi:hypothetical protein
MLIPAMAPKRPASDGDAEPSTPPREQPQQLPEAEAPLRRSNRPTRTPDSFVPSPGKRPMGRLAGPRGHRRDSSGAQCSRSSAGVNVPDQSRSRCHRGTAGHRCHRGNSEGEGKEHSVASSKTGLEPTGAPRWLWWPPTRGQNAGPPPRHRVCNTCKCALSAGSVTKAHRTRNCTCDSARSTQAMSHDTRWGCAHGPYVGPAPELISKHAPFVTLPRCWPCFKALPDESLGSCIVPIHRCRPSSRTPR